MNAAAAIGDDGFDTSAVVDRFVDSAAIAGVAVDRVVVVDDRVVAVAVDGGAGAVAGEADGGDVERIEPTGYNECLGRSAGLEIDYDYDGNYYDCCDSDPDG